MYCPSCGAETIEGSKFCKRCGGNMAPLQVQATQPAYLAKPTGAAVALSLAATAIGLGGLGIVWASVFNTMPFNGPLSDGAIAIGIIALIFGSATVFGVVAMLIRVMTRLMGVPVVPGKIYREIEDKNLKSSYSAPRLPGASIPVSSSVTEHTTRNFEPRMYSGIVERE
jgi:hypothetical protein